MENNFHFDFSDELRKINDLQALSDIFFILRKSIRYQNKPNNHRRFYGEYLESFIAQCGTDPDDVRIAMIIRDRYSYMNISNLRYDEQLIKCSILDAYDESEETDYRALYTKFFSLISELSISTSLDAACKLIKFKTMYDKHISYNIEKKFVHHAAYFTFNFIIGSAGSGKSTVIKRLQKLYDITPHKSTFTKTYFVNDNTFIFDGDTFYIATNRRFHQSATSIVEAILHYNDNCEDVRLRDCEIKYNGEIRNIFVCITNDSPEKYINEFINGFKDKYNPSHCAFNRMSDWTNKIRFHVNLHYLVDNYTTRVEALVNRISHEAHAYVNMYRDEITQLNDMKFRCYKMMNFACDFLPTGYFDNYSGHNDVRSTTHLLYIEHQADIASTNGRA